MLEWYAWLSQLNAALSEPLTTWSERLNIPVLTALLLGLLGSMAPCQLTTNASAMGLVARRMADVKGAWKTALAYTASKVVVYSLVGSLILALGLQLDLATIPVAVWARKALGPLMLVIGLYLVGVFQLHVSPGQGLSRWLEGRVSHAGVTGAFCLGLIFSLAFCPTLFWLFFGLLIPLAVAYQGEGAFRGCSPWGRPCPCWLHLCSGARDHPCPRLCNPDEGGRPLSAPHRGGDLPGGGTARYPHVLGLVGRRASAIECGHGRCSRTGRDDGKQGGWGYATTGRVSSHHHRNGHRTAPAREHTACNARPV